jgi:hypothetical protein
MRDLVPDLGHGAAVRALLVRQEFLPPRNGLFYVLDRAASLEALTDSILSF